MIVNCTLSGPDRDVNYVSRLQTPLPAGCGGVAFPMARTYPIRYPRRQASRWCLRRLTGGLIHHFGELEITGLEHVPKTGPVILAANHFAFTDAPLLLYASPRQVEFIGGAERPNSPVWTRMIPQAWGFIRAYRGGFSRSTLTASLGVLEQGGVLGIFPEGGNWATLLRPARPGLAFLALHSGAPVIPVSITGSVTLLAKPREAVGVQFHPAISPPMISATGRAKRLALDAFSETVMASVAAGLPDAQRGRYAADPAARIAAEAVSAFPFHAPEMRGM